MIAEEHILIDDARHRVTENASLLDRNTFRVPARARRLVEVKQPDGLADALRTLPDAPLLVLGGGSNILFTRDWPGTVLSLETRGVDIVEDDADRAVVHVQAGENWNDFVRWSLAHGFNGLENLVLIPGNVGAAPIQNIGAYGTEVAEFVHAVEVFDRRSGQPEILSRSDCEFGYRDSIFKRHPDRHLVTAVQFEMRRDHPTRLGYAGVREELAAVGANPEDRSAIADAIARLRLRKLPNPTVIGNAGSFFKNPQASTHDVVALHKANPSLPHWPMPDGHVKLSAAWLIESCGFKGLREGDAAVSTQHALVLVNLGSATGAQIWALAGHVRDAVERKFGVRIEPEPLIV